jgi:hypothetical protein
MGRFRCSKKHIAQKLTVHNKAKSNKKHEKIIDHAIMLVRKEDVQGNTPWIKHAKGRLAIKMKKHGMTMAKIERTMVKR